MRLTRQADAGSPESPTAAICRIPTPPFAAIVLCMPNSQTALASSSTTQTALTGRLATFEENIASAEARTFEELVKEAEAEASTTNDNFSACFTRLKFVWTAASRNHQQWIFTVTRRDFSAHETTMRCETIRDQPRPPLASP